MRPLQAILTVAAALAAAIALQADTGRSEALESARAERRAGKLESAAGLLEGALERYGPDSAGSERGALFRELGEIRFQQRRGGDAAQWFERALQAQPGEGVIHYQAGLAYRMAGKEEVARRHLDRAVALGFRTTASLLHLALATFETGNASAGWEVARSLLEQEPQSADALVQVGRALFDRFFYKDAVRAFEAAVSLSPGSYEARLFLALSAYLLDRYDDTVKHLASLDEQAATAESASLLASAMARQGRFAEAEHLLLETIERYPSSPHAYLNLAFVLLSQGRSDEAEARFVQFQRLSPSQPPKVFFAIRADSCSVEGSGSKPAQPDRYRADAYVELAASLAQRHHHGTALAVLGLAQRYEGRSARILQAMASSCLHLDPHAPAAIGLLEGALRVDPRRAGAFHLLGRALLQQGRREEALAAHRSAVPLDPSNSAFQAEFGRALAEGTTEADRIAAIEAYENATELDARNAVARYELAKLYSGAGRAQDAIRVLEEAIRAVPEFHNAHYLLGQLQLRAGLRDEARASLNTFRRLQAAAEARSGSESGFATSGN